MGMRVTIIKIILPICVFTNIIIIFISLSDIIIDTNNLKFFSGLAVFHRSTGVRKRFATMAKKRSPQTQRQHHFDKSCYLTRVCQVYLFNSLLF